MWKVVQVCFNEYGRWVFVLVVLAGPLGVIIGECDKPGSKRRMRAQIVGPSIRTRNQESENVETRSISQKSASNHKIPKNAFATVSK